jgi:hypothetical protein
MRDHRVSQPTGEHQQLIVARREIRTFISPENIVTNRKLVLETSEVPT